MVYFFVGTHSNTFTHNEFRQTKESTIREILVGDKRREGIVNSFANLGYTLDDLVQYSQPLREGIILFILGYISIIGIWFVM